MMKLCGKVFPLVSEIQQYIDDFRLKNHHLLKPFLPDHNAIYLLTAVAKSTSI